MHVYWKIVWLFVDCNTCIPSLAVKEKSLTPPPTNEDSECDTEDEIEKYVRRVN